MISLSLDDVHVWLLSIDHARDADLVAARAILDDEERSRAQRFHRERDRQTFIASHAFVRRTLSRYADRDPASWRFARTAAGRPELAPSDANGLRFNLSHTDGLAACAVAYRDVGVDVEQVRPIADAAAIAEAFAPRERAVLAALTGRAQIDHFFALWTLKEAILKATGDGLATPLADVEIAVDGSRIDARLRSDTAWRAALARVGSSHLLAVALRSATASIAVHAGELPLTAIASSHGSVVATVSECARRRE